MGKKNNKRKQQASSKMQGATQLDACDEAVKLGMTQEQYERYLQQKKEIEEEYEQDEEKNEEQD